MEHRVYHPRARAALTLTVRSDAPDAGPLTAPNVRPRKLKYTSNPPKMADKWSLEVDERWIPLDPLAYLDVLADIHLGDVGQMGGALELTSDTRLCLGNASRIAKVSGLDGDVARLEGLDYTGLIMNAKWGGLRLRLGRPLDVLVREVLANIPAVAGIEVRSELGEVPVVPAGRTRRSKHWRGKAEAPVWEVLLEIALTVGVTLIVVEDAVVIRAPRTFSPTRDSHPVVTLGRDLVELELTRKMGNQDTPNIRVVSTDPATRKAVAGLYPSTSEARAKLRASKIGGKTRKTKKPEYTTFVVHHPAPSVANLTAIARAIWERWAYRQLEVKLKTNELFLPLYDPTRPEAPRVRGYAATRVRNGTPIRVEIARDARRVLERAQSEDQARRALMRQGLAARTANLLAKSWRDLSQTYWVETATHTFDGGAGGYSLSIDAGAYLEAPSSAGGGGQ